VVVVVEIMDPKEMVEAMLVMLVETVELIAIRLQFLEQHNLLELV